MVHYLVFLLPLLITSRKRHKSAPYLRLKNIKRTLKSSILIQYPKNSGTLLDFLTSIVAKHQKVEGGIFFKKSLTMPKKLKGGTIWEFSTTFLSPSLKKLKRDPLRNFFSKKQSHNAEKTERGPFSLARYCMLRGKTFLVQFAVRNGSI